MPRSLVDPIATDRANTAGTLTILEAARHAKARRVVLTSSSSVYGAAAALPTPETAAPQPRSPYAVSKLAGEHYGRVYAELFGLSTVSLRLFNVYGPGQSADGPYAQLIPRFIAALHANEPPTVDGDGDGTQSRDIVYVADVAAAFLAVLDVLDAVRHALGRTAKDSPARHGPPAPATSRTPVRTRQRPPASWGGAPPPASKTAFGWPPHSAAARPKRSGASRGRRAGGACRRPTCRTGNRSPARPRTGW